MLKESRAYFRCGSLNHFLKDCPERNSREIEPTLKPNVSVSQGKPPRYPESSNGGRNVAKDSTTRSEARALARTYAIRTREEASAPDVITGTFSFHNVHVITLIDPGSTHSYICMKLESSMNMSEEPMEFVIKVSNPLGKSVLQDKVCKNCPFTIQGHCFLANHMLLPFDEFDVILGMDWLAVHDVIANFGSKYIELKCSDSEIFRVDSSELNTPPVVITSMMA
ncbi:uncharacterized protein LOC128283882 [Gossypium arboreum]|uniref:uncharacterized protein LOC128283882 n=1 Tax=Gossypium arboreum TaxID=29729 RepID=UPI0022F19983|nr:uncharacterized protein LOC128283882 [Gossypium arboreum]